MSSNAFTFALAKRAVSNPQQHADLTMALGGLLDPEPKTVTVEAITAA